jgi:hypothetical protein
VITHKYHITYVIKPAILMKYSPVKPAFYMKYSQVKPALMMKKYDEPHLESHTDYLGVLLEPIDSSS